MYAQVPRGAGALKFEDPRLSKMMAAPPRPSAFFEYPGESGRPCPVRELAASRGAAGALCRRTHLDQLQLRLERATGEAGDEAKRCSRCSFSSYEQRPGLPIVRSTSGMAPASSSSPRRYMLALRPEAGCGSRSTALHPAHERLAPRPASRPTWSTSRSRWTSARTPAAPNVRAERQWPAIASRCAMLSKPGSWELAFDVRAGGEDRAAHPRHRARWVELDARICASRHEAGWKPARSAGLPAEAGEGAGGSRRRPRRRPLACALGAAHRR